MTGEAITVNVTGLEELGRALASFGDVLGAKYLHRATYAGAALIAADAQARAPRGETGLLAANVAIFKRPSPDGYTVKYVIGERGIKLTRKVKKLLRILHKETGKRQSITGDTFYWSFVEFGFTHVGGKVIPPRPFFTTAFENNKDAAVDVFRTVLADGVQAAAAEVAS